MNKKYAEYESMYEYANEELIHLKNRYAKQGLPVNYINYYNRLRCTYSKIGFGKLLIEGKVEECKKNFYKSAYMTKIINEKLEGALYDENWAYGFWNQIDQLYFAILSDSYSLVIELIKLIGNIKEQEIKVNDQKFVYYVMYFYKNYILNNMDAAKESLKELRKTTEEDIADFCLLLPDIFEALLCSDDKKLSDMLNVFCSESIKSSIYVDTFQEVVCIEGLAIAKLAIISGLNIKLDKSVVGTELLEKVDIDYPNIDIV